MTVPRFAYPTAKVRKLVTLSAATAEAVDRFRHRQRINTEGQALVELVRAGLDLNDRDATAERNET